MVVMAGKSVDLFLNFYFYFIIWLLIKFFYFFGSLSGIFCFSTRYDGAPLRSPVIGKGVMLGVLPKQ